jgi:hypothetical protein
VIRVKARFGLASLLFGLAGVLFALRTRSAGVAGAHRFAQRELSRVRPDASSVSLSAGSGAAVFGGV